MPGAAVAVLAVLVEATDCTASCATLLHKSAGGS